MSQLAERARSEARAKIGRLMRTDPDARVDASGYQPAGPLDGDIQTGPRPISRRQYKSGGRILGDLLRARADRKPRATGGRAIIDEYINRDVKQANELRPGTKHDGGWNAGGRVARASGGKVHKDEAQDRALIHKMGCKCAKCSGGRVRRAEGGPIDKDNGWVPVAGRGRIGPHDPESGTNPRYNADAVQKEINKDPRIKGREAKAIHRLLKGGYAKGGAIPDGTRPVGGRLARKEGGRAKKGMNVNIIIAPSQSKPAMMPPPGAIPPPGGGPAGIPAPPPAAAPAPMVAPAGAAPMMRKSGGRAVDGGGLAKPGKYPLKNAGGGGLGRLEKIRAYG